MSVLVVAAHPDDEVLGFGATGWRWTQAGQLVRACFLCGDADARGNAPGEGGLDQDMRAAQRHLGFGEPIVGRFPNIRLNTIAHLELVQFVEEALLLTDASTVVTHHPHDLNDDHRQVAAACQAAVRLGQRRQVGRAVQRLIYMEVPSSTDWSVGRGSESFQPNTYVEVGEDGVQRKLEALAMYAGVMRTYPHPRSERAILALAAQRGSMSGLDHAEAFETVFQILDV